MQNYNSLIHETLIGDTPKEKLVNLIVMKKILTWIGYPTMDDPNTLQDFSETIQLVFTLEELEKGVK